MNYPRLKFLFGGLGIVRHPGFTEIARAKGPNSITAGGVFVWYILLDINHDNENGTYEDGHKDNKDKDDEMIYIKMRDGDELMDDKG